MTEHDVAVTLCHSSRNLQCNSDSGRCYVNGGRKKTQVWSCVKNFPSISVVIHLLKTIVDKVDKLECEQESQFCSITFQITSV